MKNVIFAGLSMAALCVAMPLAAQNNSSTVTQTGDLNDADVDQTGSGNTVTIDQISATDGTVGQIAITAQSGSGNTSDIDQDGDGNNFTRTGQMGTNSLAMVEQTAASFAVTAIIDQGVDTDNNTGTIIQSDGRANGAQIIQNGTGPGLGANNFSSILQGDTTNIGGTAVFAETVGATNTQSGQNNSSDIVQSGVSTSVGVNQIGDANISFVTQGDLGGDFNNGSVLQNGDGNQSGLFQSSDQNTGNISQIGDSNFAGVQQGFVGGAATGGNRNSGTITQNGNRNRSSIFQNDTLAGELNIAVTNQLGDDAVSTIIQDGTSNQAFVIQYEASVSSITQTGTGNFADVTQGTP